MRARHYEPLLDATGWQVRTGMSRRRERAFAARVDPAFEERWIGTP